MTRCTEGAHCFAGRRRTRARAIDVIGREISSSDQVTPSLDREVTSRCSRTKFSCLKMTPCVEATRGAFAAQVPYPTVSLNRSRKHVAQLATVWRRFCLPAGTVSDVFSL
ncbi:hypothetical protein AVEN_52138-1 [Araneus ventricosus]|uniref:Uncharacterized protein n=1 Tax=Araneus ventricosus TaxID=182803 RepID=A0A4Y2S837_ARAVE|nr:hypothetical protein AVEN_52138-1 [Araneus ventricosus]